MKTNREDRLRSKLKKTKTRKVEGEIYSYGEN